MGACPAGVHSEPLWAEIVHLWPPFSLTPIHLSPTPSCRSPLPSPPTLRNLYKRKVNQLVSIFSATDSVLETDRGR